MSKFWLDPELAQIVMPIAERKNKLLKFTAAANAAATTTTTTTTVVLHLEHFI